MTSIVELKPSFEEKLEDKFSLNIDNYIRKEI